MAFRNDQVSETETEKILKLARGCVQLPGDFVELGCYAGDTSLALAEVLKSAGSSSRLWIYDSFEGLPEKSDYDNSEVGKDFVAGALAVSKRDVKVRFLKAGLPVPVIKKAWFSELTDADLPSNISFAFLDGDLYESIRDSLRLVEKRMCEGGVIVVHDYMNPALPGVMKAVDEWLSRRKAKTQIIESMMIIS